jgi:hypothetical protein
VDQSFAQTIILMSGPFFSVLTRRTGKDDDDLE